MYTSSSRNAYSNKSALYTVYYTNRPDVPVEYMYYTPYNSMYLTLP